MENTGKARDWPVALKWGPVECKVSRVKGSEEEEEDLLEALEDLDGAVERRRKAWSAYEAQMVVEVIEGKRV